MASAGIAAGSVCELNGWCWYNPLPSGAFWLGVGGAGRTDMWIGGIDTPNLLHFDGGQWHVATSALSVTEAIWAASETDVWFVGGTGTGTAGLNQAIAHWDGSAMSLSAVLGEGELEDVWGSGPSDVYAVGFGTLQHWNGIAWSVVPGIRGSNVSGSGPDDVWVGAFERPVSFRRRHMVCGPGFEGTFVDSLTVVGPNDIWALTTRYGGAQAVEHFDGTNRSVSLQLPATNSLVLEGIRGASSQDVWLVGVEFIGLETRGYVNHFDGSVWTRAPNAPTWLERVRIIPAWASSPSG